MYFLRKFIAPPARVLDIGAGRGRFVAVANSRGYVAQGIEPSRRGISAAAAIGIHLQQTTIEEAHLEPASFDAITVWHVLEHLEEPGETLRRVAGWLRPGGVLLIGVPNIASLQARLGGAKWFHLDLPRHRTHFTPRGLKELLTRTGYNPMTEHHILLEHNPFGMWQSLVNHFTETPSYLFNLLKRNTQLVASDLTRTILASSLVPAAILLEFFAGALRRGGTVVIVAKKP
jgi:SAM-dependent methyltransferase